MYPRGRAAIALHLTHSLNGHISRQIISEIKKRSVRASLGRVGWLEGVHRVKGGVYINGGRRAFTIPRSTSALITSCLQPTEPAAMAFNGTWKVDRSENYDKFMEQMGECGSH